MTATVEVECAAHAERLELEAATDRLVDSLFPGTDEPAGRYHFLTTVIEQRPAFRQALLDGDETGVQREWQQAVGDHASDSGFLHGLAVLHRERALDSSSRGALDEHSWMVGTALWVLLLSCESFWVSFWSLRAGGLDRDELLGECLQTTLSIHGTLGKRAFAAGHSDRARIHLRCLDVTRAGEAALLAALEENGVACSLATDPRRLARASAVAASLIDEWCRGLLREAKRAAEDSEAIQALPEGIRLNYEGGIGELQAFLDLDVPDRAVLSGALHWYNDWCYDLYVKKEVDLIGDTMRPARTVADRLAPLCTRVQGFLPENKALSQHFLLRGFTSDDPEAAIEEYKQALAWDETNTNAEELLQGQAQQVLLGQLHTAIECSEKGQWDEAYGILDRIEARMEGDDAESVRHARSVVSFHRAGALANEYEFRDALKLAREVLESVPDAAPVANLVSELEELAPEQDNIRHLRAAREAHDADDYARAIRASSRVPRSSRFYPQAREIAAAAHFYRGIEHANSERFKQAADDLARALALVGADEGRKQIALQLDQVRIAPFAKALEQGDLDRAEKILSKLESRSPLIDKASEALAVAFFKRGIEHANEHRFDEAIADLEKAAQVTPDEENQEQIRSQLGALRRARDAAPVHEALEKGDLALAERLLRVQVEATAWYPGAVQARLDLAQILTMRAVQMVNASGGSHSVMREAAALLEEARVLDPKNEGAKTNLKTLKKMM